MEESVVVENTLYWKSEDAGPNIKIFNKSISLDPRIFMWKLN